MASNAQVAQKLRDVKEAQVQSLREAGFKDLSVSMRATLFPEYIQWGSGLLSIDLAANRKTDNQEFYFKILDASTINTPAAGITSAVTNEWSQLSAVEQGKFLVRGIRIRSRHQSFVMAANKFASTTWGNTSLTVTKTQQTEAPKVYADYDAEELTTAILTAHQAEGYEAPAAKAVREYKAFLKEGGDEQDDNSVWNLPTINQAHEIYRYHTSLQNILTALWGITFNWGYIHTCQSYSEKQLWRVHTLCGETWYSNKSENFIVVAISNK